MNFIDCIFILATCVLVWLGRVLKKDFDSYRPPITDKELEDLFNVRQQELDELESKIKKEYNG